MCCIHKLIEASRILSQIAEPAVRCKTALSVLQDTLYLMRVSVPEVRTWVRTMTGTNGLFPSLPILRPSQAPEVTRHTAGSADGLSADYGTTVVPKNIW